MDIDRTETPWRLTAVLANELARLSDGCLGCTGCRALLDALVVPDVELGNRQGR